MESSSRQWMPSMKASSPLGATVPLKVQTRFRPNAVSAVRAVDLQSIPM